MPKFFITEDKINKTHIIFDKENFHHLKNVMRVKLNDNITASDEMGHNYVCVVDSIDKSIITARIKDITSDSQEPEHRITLYQSIPKSDKMDLIIQKSVELGIYSIVPMITSRTAVKLDEDKTQKRVNRWQKISEAAAKQSLRGIIPEIKPVCSFKEAANLCSKLDRSAIPYELETENKLLSFINMCKKNNAANIGIMIGPEGGFTDEEVEFCKSLNIYPLSLGKRILRTETAGFYTLSVILFLLEERTSDYVNN